MNDCIYVPVGVVAEKGIKDLTVNASSLFDAHRPLKEHIKNGVVSTIQTDYMSQELGRFISLVDFYDLSGLLINRTWDADTAPADVWYGPSEYGLTVSVDSDALRTMLEEEALPEDLKEKIISETENEWYDTKIQIYQNGDANQDGRLTARDAQIILNYYSRHILSGIASSEDITWFNELYDFDHSGTADLEDAQKVLQAYVKELIQTDPNAQ